MTTSGERSRKPAIGTIAKVRRPGFIANPVIKEKGRKKKEVVGEAGVSERRGAKVAQMGNRRSAPPAEESLAERQKKLVANLVAKRRPRV